MTTKERAAFDPTFTITPAVAKGLMRIEAVKQAIQTLPITPRVLANLRETARLFSIHYSTMIEGNRLTQEQVAQVIGETSTFQDGSETRPRSKATTPPSTKRSAWQREVRTSPRRPCKS